MAAQTKPNGSKPKRQTKQQAVIKDAPNEKPVSITHEDFDRLSNALENLKMIAGAVNLCRNVADEHTALTIEPTDLVCSLYLLSDGLEKVVADFDSVLGE